MFHCYGCVYSCVHRNLRCIGGDRVTECLSCARGFYFECGHEPPPEIPQVLTEAPKKERFANRNVSVSAGRKRAAELYPLDQTKPCEWAGLANVGGGKHPILGCQPGQGLQKHRHHGPDKDTTNNEPGNVHRICHRCHNYWHAKNDRDYEPLPHAPHAAAPVDAVNWLAAGNKL
jgi:hypothetical protein